MDKENLVSMRYASTRQHAAGSKNFAKRFTSDRDDINDLVQDTFVKAIQYANKFYQGSNLRARLSVKLKNTYINSYRKVVKTRKVIDLLLFHSALYTESSRRNPAETKFILNSIQSAFNKLPDEIHQIIGLHLSGYKNREIATLTGNKLGTVKNWIHKGRNELKHSLGECQFTV